METSFLMLRYGTTTDFEHVKTYKHTIPELVEMTGLTVGQIYARINKEKELSKQNSAQIATPSQVEQTKKQ